MVNQVAACEDCVTPINLGYTHLGLGLSQRDTDFYILLRSIHTWSLMQYIVLTKIRLYRF